VPAERRSYHGLNEPGEFPLKKFLLSHLDCVVQRFVEIVCAKESGDHMRSLLLNVRNRVKRLDCSCRVAAQFNPAANGGGTSRLQSPRLVAAVAELSLADRSMARILPSKET